MIAKKTPFISRKLNLEKAPYKTSKVRLQKITSIQVFLQQLKMQIPVMK